jgi:hypothetical protein
VKRDGSYLANRLVRWGAILLLLGTGPLFLIIIAAAAGLWPDPNPNPIGPGLLAFFTFWPALALIAVGMLQVRADRRREAE